jgi:hypothetical protein
LFVVAKMTLQCFDPQTNVMPIDERADANRELVQEGGHI